MRLVCDFVQGAHASSAAGDRALYIVTSSDARLRATPARRRAGFHRIAYFTSLHILFSMIITGTLIIWVMLNVVRSTVFISLGT